MKRFFTARFFTARFFTALCLILLLTFPVTGQAITWTVANQSTVAWDAVTTTEDDNPIPAGDTVEYELFLVLSSSTEKDADKLSQGTTQALEYTLTFPSEGRWLAGVQAVRIPEESPEDKKYSKIVWSDDSTLVSETFGFVFFALPKGPGGFAPK